jgi:hypothetical protein
MHGLDGNPRSVIPRTRTTRHQFAFGGVAFEVLADKSVHWELPEFYLRHVVDASETAIIADAVCSISVDRALPSVSPSERALSFEHDGAHTQVTASQMHAQLSEIRAGKYAVTARIAPGPGGASAVLLGVASAILQRLGGLNLHAAAIELDGEAILFLGPSGAGKSTAASLALGAQLFAYDRVSIAPGPEGRIWAFSMPGGEAIAGAVFSDRRALPLAALARVRHGQPAGEPTLRLLAGAARLFSMREAVEVGDAGDGAEERRLQIVSTICEQVPVFELHTVLGKPIHELLRAGLASTRPTIQMQETT